MKKSGTVLLLLAVMGANIALDQITKILARVFLRGEGIIEVLGNLFILVYAENEGAFLSMGSGLPAPVRLGILTILPLLVIIGMIVFLFRSRTLNFGQKIALACVIGGGLSNIADRIFFNGVVTDFMNFGIGSLRTGVLNIADLSITFGAIVLIVLEFIREKREAQKATENDTPTE